MLYKRHQSVYASTPVKGDYLHNIDTPKQKLLSPLLPARAHQSIEQPQSQKTIIRKQSKSKNGKAVSLGTFYLHRGNNHPIVKTVLE